jgi:hypothetical protein
LVGNWNRCLELATGAYICIFHQDDIMLPENLANKVRILDGNPEIGLVYSNVYRINAQGQVIASEWFFKTEPNKDQVIPPPNFFKELISGKNLICCPSVLARRKCYEKLGGFDTSLPFTGDWEMWLRIALFYPVAYLASPLVKYRVHETNETHNFRELKQLEQYYLCKMLAIERHQGSIPDYHQLKAYLIDQHEKHAFALVFHYYQQRQYSKAKQALAFATTLAVATAVQPSWNNQYIEWLSHTTPSLWTEPASLPDTLQPGPTSPSALPYDLQFIPNQLSGEEIARQIPLNRIIQALAFKIGNQPGLGWLYKFRGVGKKILGGR